MAQETLAIAEKKKLPLCEFGVELTHISKHGGTWEDLEFLAREVELFLTTTSNLHNYGLDALSRTKRLFRELLEAAQDVPAQQRQTANLLRTFCVYCGFPTHAKSLYYCKDHRYDGKDYRRLRRMEHWASSKYHLSLKSLLKREWKAIRAKKRANPELLLHGKVAERYHSKFKQWPDAVQLIQYVIGKHHPPSQKLLALAISTGEHYPTGPKIFAPTVSSEVKMLCRHEAWLLIQDQYRHSVMGRPKEWTFDDIRPALQLMKQGHKRGAAEKKYRIPHRTMSRLLKRFEAEVSAVLGR